ncbi:sugar transferase [Enterococcus xiangfangensis]|uniref:sugar transferase n=1 Tax=Enterococcus xiangfangensis TaxID=1296537 RepID=UPI0010F9C50F|nr:sugar transferase [Enterococcus xiangfangensis]MBM7710857.1 lipopolysaccharide/colanic/teichoic acid biosynthesis glycosyltransferase [Enterococcus xiangfangensis]
MKNKKTYGSAESLENQIHVDQRHFKLGWLDKSKVERKGYNLIKRIVDIILGCLGLIFISPIMLWIAYKIRKENPDVSVIFSQQRIGQNGRAFTMYKFRSMCVDAEEQLGDLLKKNEVDGAMFKMKDDPRVTNFGKFIRRTSLDELPQLFNVIKGDMSLIGPRPPLEREVAEYTNYDLQRLFVKPGCSGLWQVSGRSEIQFKEMVELDIEYIKKRSLGYDISLIAKTIKVILKKDGAY